MIAASRQSRYHENSKIRPAKSEAYGSEAIPRNSEGIKWHGGFSQAETAADYIQ